MRRRKNQTCPFDPTQRLGSIYVDLSAISRDATLQKEYTETTEIGLDTSWYIHKATVFGDMLQVEGEKRQNGTTER